MSTSTTTPPVSRQSEEQLRREAVQGAAAILPLLVGYLPFGLLIGVAAGASSDPLAAWAGALLIFLNYWPYIWGRPITAEQFQKASGFKVAPSATPASEYR